MLTVKAILQVLKNGVAIARRPDLNFVEGTGVTLTIADNATSNRTDVTINSMAGVLNWLLAGNAGTTPGTDFIGTTDAKDWQIKTNNILRALFNADGAFQLDTGTIVKKDISFDIVIKSGYAMVHRDLIVSGDLTIESDAELFAL